MDSITGIELGIDSCVLVRARQRQRITDVSAVHATGRGDWPTHPDALAAALRRIRREKKFPRRARVVAWHLSESPSVSQTATRAALRPLTAAGFHIEAVISPPQALALLAASRPRPEGTAAAWLALNRNGAAIAIVRGTELLFTREFDWSYKGDGATPNAQLLERYSLVAHLAPELRRGMDLVRSTNGAQVDSAITCGDLPDLRSLTMPLIEELDLEVETLDSIDGLAISGAARTQRLAELAPALRLACAVITAHPERRAVTPVWLRAAAAVVVVTGFGWLAYVASRSRESQGPKPQTPVVAAAQQTPRPVRPAAKPAIQASRSETAPSKVTPRAPAPQRPAAVAHRGAVLPPSPPAKVTPGSPTGRRPAVPRVPSKTASSPPNTRPRPLATPAKPAASSSIKPRTDIPPKVHAPKTDTPLAAPAPAQPRPRPLNAPVPAVTSILISADRRLAVIDGRIVGVGDPVGPRVVARIEQSAVVLREPSGFELRVQLR